MWTMMIHSNKTSKLWAEDTYYELVGLERWREIRCLWSCTRCEWVGGL